MTSRPQLPTYSNEYWHLKSVIGSHDLASPSHMYRSCDCHAKSCAPSTFFSMSACTMSRLCTSIVMSVMILLRSSFVSSPCTSLISASSRLLFTSRLFFSESSAPFSSSSSAVSVSSVHTTWQPSSASCAAYIDAHSSRGWSTSQLDAAVSAWSRYVHSVSCMHLVRSLSHFSTAPTIWNGVNSLTISPSFATIALAVSLTAAVTGASSRRRRRPSSSAARARSA